MFRIEKAEIDAVAPDLEEVKKHVAQLAGLGSRVAGYEGNKKARDYLISTLESFGYPDGTSASSLAPDDALAQTPITVQAFTDIGQTLSTIKSLRVKPSNVRIHITDEDRSILSGIVVVQGTGQDGRPLVEELVIPLGGDSIPVLVGDLPFQSISTITLKNLAGSLSVIAGEPADRIQVGYGIRFSILTQKYEDLVPYDNGRGKISLVDAGAVVGDWPLYGIWPNGVAVSTTGSAGMAGPIVYGKSGNCGDLDGQVVKDALVLIELTDQTTWTQVAALGAKAVVVIEPETSLRTQMEGLFLTSPVEFARFWMPRNEGLALRKAIEDAFQAGKQLSVNLKVEMAWKNSLLENVGLLIPGTGRFRGPFSASLKQELQAILSGLSSGPEQIRSVVQKVDSDLSEYDGLVVDFLARLEALVKLLKDAGSSNADLEKWLNQQRRHFEAARKSTVVLSAYYDSCSIVPALAPGAEQALGCATLLELARSYRTHPPARDTLLLFCNSHFQGMAGARHFFAASSLDNKGNPPPEVISGPLLKETIQNTMVDLQVLAKIVEQSKEALPVRSDLMALVREAQQEFQFGNDRFVGLANASPRGPHLAWTIAGAAWFFLGFSCWIFRIRARRLALALTAPISLVILFYSIAVPLMLQRGSGSGGDQPPGKVLDELLNKWKQDAFDLGAAHERKIRLCQDDQEQGTEPSREAVKAYQDALSQGDQEAADRERRKWTEWEKQDSTGVTSELRAAIEEQMEFEAVGRILNSRTEAGLNVRTEEQNPSLAQKLVQSRVQTVQRLRRLAAWAQTEHDCQIHNRPFVSLVRDRLADPDKRHAIFLSLDLSSGNPGVALVADGSYYGQTDSVAELYGTWGRPIKALSEAIERGMGITVVGSRIPDTLAQIKGRSWDTYLGAPLAVASEIAIQAKLRGLTLVTPFDRRLIWDTPRDLLGSQGQLAQGGWSRVNEQLRFVGVFFDRLSSYVDLTHEGRVQTASSGLSQIVFSTVRHGGSRSSFPDLPLPDAVVVQVGQVKTIAGVRRPFMGLTNPLGRVRIPGLPQSTSPNFEVYKCDPDTGEIEYALNMPKHLPDGNATFSVFMYGFHQSKTLETFQAQGLAILDILDPGRLVALRNCRLLAGRTESSPYAFSLSHASNQEPHRVVFAEPGSRVKCLFGEGVLGFRMAVLNVEREDLSLLMNPKTRRAVPDYRARGAGFRLGPRKVLDWLPLRAASDFWALNEQRLGTLREHSIGNINLDNPNYPGRYSTGTVTVAKGSDRVVGNGVHWDDDVVGCFLTFSGRAGKYEVQAFEAPDGLILENRYPFESGSGLEFTLTRQRPGLHNLAQIRLAKALQARDERRYGEAWRLANEAWGIEARAYPDVLGTANDSVNGVVFYLFLLLPFCFFFERLLFGFTRIEWQAGAFSMIFVLMFGVLWLVHPAFALVRAPPVILLALVLITLVGMVIVQVYRKFDADMHRMQGGLQAVGSAGINRGSVALLAVTLGIKQMRRRKVRTFLTCATIVLLTFTALSFTSVVPTISQSSIDLSPGDVTDAPYQGILIRNPNYSPISPVVFEQLVDEFAGENATVVPRFWSVSQKDDKTNKYAQKFFSTFNFNDDLLRIDPQALIGVSPHERDLFRKADRDPLGSDGMVAGQWIEPGDREVCLLPLKQAARLQPGKKEGVAWRPENALGQSVRIGSLVVTIKGIFDSDLVNDLQDLDGEPLTPVDFEASEKSRGGAVDEASEAIANGSESALATRFTHVNALDAVIVPWQLSQNLGAELYSMAIRLEEEPGESGTARLDYQVSRLLNLLEKSLYVGRNGRRILYVSSSHMSFTGLGNLLVPLLIAIMILLNTMVGSVFERRREIRIFSSLGLAPSHIAALFITEAFVYATLGAVFGYLFGQGVAKLVQMEAVANLLGVSGLYLNYSSSAAVFVTGVVMLTVLGSTIYPALLAAREAAPSEERSWSVPEPEGDEISMELPFSFQRDLVPGSALFMYEYFASHMESSLGNFTAKDVTLEAFHSEKGPGICLFFMAWLAPYDLGVSQEVQIYIVPVDGELYVAEASFYRVSGYADSWQRVNRPFLNALRKHLLVWRTYSPRQRQLFSDRGYAHFQEAFEAIGWPAPTSFRRSDLIDPDLLIRAEETGIMQIAVVGPPELVSSDDLDRERRVDEEP